MVLTGRGAEVISVGSGGEALAEMKRQRCDVLTIDAAAVHSRAVERRNSNNSTYSYLSAIIGST